MAAAAGETGRRRIAGLEPQRVDNGALDQHPRFRIELLLAGRPEVEDLLTVGLDHRHVDGVERGSGHEPEDAHAP